MVDMVDMVDIEYVDTCDQLEDLELCLRRSRLLALDSEWPPTGPQAASLLQLGLLVEPSSGNPCDSFVRRVIVVDVQVLVEDVGGLAKATLKRIVREALDRRDLLKIAHSLIQ
jgi:hypothetical protein